MLSAEKYIFNSIFKKYTKSIPKEKRVLDFACNNFYHAHLLLHTHYTGADIDPKRVKEGLRNYPQFEGLVADLTHPLKYFKKSTYDVVISTHTLNYLDPNRMPQIISALSDITRGELFFNLINRSRNYERDLDLVLKKKFATVRKVRYCGVVSEMWTQFLMGYPVHSTVKKGIPIFFKKRLIKNIKNTPVLVRLLLSGIAFFLVIFDFIGRKYRLIYICSNKRK